MQCRDLQMAQMRTIEYGEGGGPEVLDISTRPIPDPAPDEVLVRVAAAGVNGPDLKQRAGAYPPPPGASDLMGLEISGTVEAIGTEVRQWSVGDQVCALTNGGG